VTSIKARLSTGPLRERVLVVDFGIRPDSEAQRHVLNCVDGDNQVVCHTDCTGGGVRPQLYTDGLILTNAGALEAFACGNPPQALLLDQGRSFVLAPLPESDCADLR
jgi:hypothetical protein